MAAYYYSLQTSSIFFLDSTRGEDCEVCIGVQVVWVGGVNRKLDDRSSLGIGQEGGQAMCFLPMNLLYS